MEISEPKAMNNRQYAAMLRVIRRLSGFVEHPDAYKVFHSNNVFQFEAIAKTRLRLARMCGLNDADLKAYGEAAAKEYEVVETEGKFAFKLIEDGE
jgi:hypothetical protein